MAGKTTGGTKLTQKRKLRTQPVSDPVPVHEHRDWWSMLTPIFITVGLSVVANVGTGIWQGATFKAQVTKIDSHQAEQDAAISKQAEALQVLYTRLPIDYMPRAEIERNRELTKEMRDIEQRQLEQLSNKLDQLLANRR